MKKLFITIALQAAVLGMFAQTPLSTILSWFEAGDKPTQSQFEIAWRNSYNAVTDGIFHLTGYPTISVEPHSSPQIAKFYWGNITPTDTSYSLAFGGILRVSKLYVGNEIYSPGGSGGGDSFWELNGTTLRLSTLSQNVSIGSATSSGYKLYVNGSFYATASVRTNTLTLIGSGVGAGTGSISINTFGDMQFTDEFNTTPVKLSDLMSASRWGYNGNRVYSLSGDSVSIGDNIADRLFNVYGTSYFSAHATFDGDALFNESIYVNDHIETPSLNIRSGGSLGAIDMDGANMMFSDGVNATPVSLTDLIASGTNYWRQDIVGGVVNPSVIQPAVGITGVHMHSGGTFWNEGSTLLTGTLSAEQGITVPAGKSVYFGNARAYENNTALTFYDPIAGITTLSELKNPIGNYIDSLSVNKLNFDTAYFNGVTYKSFYSSGGNDITMKIQNGTWSWSYYNPVSIFFTGAVRFSSVSDTMQGKAGFDHSGTLYKSQEDDYLKYYTGAKWDTLATQDWAMNYFAYISESNPNLDTINFNTRNAFIHSPATPTYDNGGTYNMVAFSAYGSNAGVLISPANRSIFNEDASTGITLGGSSIDFYLNGGTLWSFNGGVWKSASDTLATMAYARSVGGGGNGGTPGGASGNLQYNNNGSFGGFWSYNGTNITPATNTGLLWSANSFIKGFSADSVRVGEKLHIINNYTSQDTKYNLKSILENTSGGLNQKSHIYLGYSDAEANSGTAVGVSSHLYINNNYSSSGNTSYSNAGRFILQNNGATEIGGGSPGSLYASAVHGEVTGTIDTSSSGAGKYVLSAIYGKANNSGNAKTWAGYFDGDVNVAGEVKVTGEKVYIGEGKISVFGNGMYFGAPNVDYSLDYSKAITASYGILSLAGKLRLSDKYTYNDIVNSGYHEKGDIFQPSDRDSLYYYTGSKWVALNKDLSSSGGTVTSVGVSGGTTGLSFSNSPITTSGTITMSGTLAVANGGTGVTTSTGTGSTVLSASPAFTGIPTAPTAAKGTNTTQLATTAFVLANSTSQSADSAWREATVKDTLHIEGAIKWTKFTPKTKYAYLYIDSATREVRIDSSAVYEGGSGGGDVIKSGATSSGQAAYWGSGSYLHGTGALKLDADSAYLPELAPSSSYRAWLTLTSTGAIDTGYVEPASKILKIDIPSIQEYLTDTLNGELKWYWVEDGDVISDYGLPRGLKDITALQGGVEIALRYILDESEKRQELEKRVEKLENYMPTDKGMLLFDNYNVFILLVLVFIALLMFFNSFK